jgi:anti-anti-sigma factor
MQYAGLAVTSSQISESVALLQMEGTITAAAEDAVMGVLERALSKGARSVILDFSAVSGLDSGGVSLLVKLHVAARKRGAALAAAGPSASVKDVFELTGLGEAIPAYENRSKALAAQGVDAVPTDPGSTERIEVALEPAGNVKRGDALQWARPVQEMHVAKTPDSRSGLNVEGRRPVGPIRGFGQMWEKTYEFRSPDVRRTPAEVAATMKENFVRFQPPQNHFYPSPAGIKAGETVLIVSSVMGVPIHTGVLVSYADDVSFTFVTPQGHPESGWVTFRAFREAEDTVCQIQGLARANDPVYEIAFRLHGSKFQEQTWKHVLGSLAKHLEVASAVTMRKRCIAPNLQWSQAGNIRHNAQLWTLAYLLIWPFRRPARAFGR